MGGDPHFGAALTSDVAPSAMDFTNEQPSGVKEEIANDLQEA